ncbi:hypothetical protein COC42_12495 [Sphingomonas spermidinifaciens]|uniref:Uncharacterized protein n=1 Tax=Sphingomonas spermidinifaciens TaxID=1141889 RepID=A0A2A4B3K2_9SPHN|nr:hypothetical protein [Sphingomonas spermidinifaciens]PCD02264.1 hypothetical protein COC42_12495 [Sphingomonas spermidinifaciens]
MLRMKEIVRFARRHRWRAETVIMMPYDGVGGPATQLRRGRSVAGGDMNPGGCVTSFALFMLADRGAT